MTNSNISHRDFINQQLESGRANILRAIREHKVVLQKRDYTMRELAECLWNRVLAENAHNGRVSVTGRVFRFSNGLVVREVL